MRPHLARSRWRAPAAAAVLAAVLAPPAFGWGHTGHAMINKLAVDALPEGPLKSFMKKHQSYISEHAIDPDIYKRKHHAEEAPKHFLNIDADASVKPEDYPKTWRAAVDRFGLHNALKQGKVPWAIEETVQDLIDAFKQKDGSKIVEKATWLGHYVGDAHQPFHTCANYDGQLTGQKGIHSIFEERMIDHNHDECEKEVVKLISTMHVAEVEGLVSFKALSWVVDGCKLAPRILDADKGNRSNGREKALWKGAGALAEKRLAEASVALASLWLTAWKRAGSPDLPGEIALPKGETRAPGEGEDDDHDHDPGKGMDNPAPGKPDATPDPAGPSMPMPKPVEPVKNPPVKGPWDGLMVREADDQPGAIVDSVEPASNVCAAGLVSNDVIIAVDGAPVNSVATLEKRAKEHGHGDKISITILREGAEHSYMLTVP